MGQDKAGVMEPLGVPRIALRKICHSAHVGNGILNSEVTLLHRPTAYRVATFDLTHASF